ncbi:MAG: hypothetical protein JSV88_07760 [Candidatus Aminicenantes bacterium]|nr:MAG: hypothetical protein JSV88_07760 [Candidatus Aminicenantes bacterium]
MSFLGLYDFISCHFFEEFHGLMISGIRARQKIGQKIGKKSVKKGSNIIIFDHPGFQI